MTISPADSVGEVEHRGHTYYFCNESCLDRFKADPDEFVGPAAASRQTCCAGGSRGGIHLPHASANPAEGSWLVPDLRDGAGAGDDHAGGSAERRTRRHDAAIQRWSLWLTAPILVFMIDEFISPGSRSRFVSLASWGLELD